MDFERKEKLNELKFDFYPMDKKKEYWNSQFKKLRCFFGKHGHCELFWAVDRFAVILNTPH
jgi:hypothetical protein